MKAPKIKSTNLHLQPKADADGQKQAAGWDFFAGDKTEAQPFFSPTTIQPKLTIGAPNDKYEKEADAMADKIASGDTNTNAFSSGQSGIQRTCVDCKKEEEEAPIQRMVEKEETVQPKLMRKSANGGGIATSALSSQLNNSKGSGSPLSTDTNASMSQAFGADFSQVRVHTGSSAIQMNQGLNARAFTHGSDVYFNQGEYNPASREGKRLLGHELTHVVQQGAKENAIQRDLASEVIKQLKVPSSIEDICTSSTKYRYNKAYKKTTGKNKPLIPKRKDDKKADAILQIRESRYKKLGIEEKYRGTGAAGVLVYLGQGKYVTKKEIWDDHKLKPGAGLQTWKKQSDFDRIVKGNPPKSWGTSMIFIKYNDTFDKVQVLHQSGKEWMSKDTFEYWVGANLN